MNQLSFDFVLLPLIRQVRTKIEAVVGNEFLMTLSIGGKMVTALVPDWVVGKGTSFIRGWLKAGGY